MIDTPINILLGTHTPLGAHWDGKGVNFALHTEKGRQVELCLFDERGQEQTIPLPGKTHFVFHGYVPGLQPGQQYGFRVFGIDEQGTRFNRNKLLLDPYARAITGELQWNDALFDYTEQQGKRVPGLNRTDSAPFVPKSLVIDNAFDWGNDAPIRRPLHETIIYELHVKGFTQLNYFIPEEYRGTYAGLQQPLVIEYLKLLGITTIELMPVHWFITEQFLADKQLRDYWGYNTIGFFAPHEAYAHDSGQAAVTEFKAMVKAMHEAGLEVILDVVFNHTAEGNENGPTLCFRGIDNDIYYRLKDKSTEADDYTGTGNTLNTEQPVVLQLIMDSLRYWVTEMHVDGFRFDLAAALARQRDTIDRFSSFFTVICQDPVISQVKLIAEPWDLKEDGYQVGNFPAHWTEWNDQFRDGIRKFWGGGKVPVKTMINCFMGGPEIFHNNGRSPQSGINFITAHDGFTLHDLVSYNKKHNAVNKEDNRDGLDKNFSSNWMVEGETNEERIVKMRKQHQRNLLAVLFLAQGIPMLCAGDEMGRTQWGNNNAYAQDNIISWLDWHHQDEQQIAFVRSLVQLRKKHSIFRCAGWLPSALALVDSPDAMVHWHFANGERISKKDFHDTAALLCVFLDAADCNLAESKADDSFYIVFNRSLENIVVQFPVQYAIAWQKVLDTAVYDKSVQPGSFVFQETVTVAPFSVSVFKKMNSDG